MARWRPPVRTVRRRGLRGSVTVLLHQIAAARLYLALSEYVKAHGGIVLFAPLDIVLTEYDVVQADILLSSPRGSTYSTRNVLPASHRIWRSRFCRPAPPRTTVV